MTDVFDAFAPLGDDELTPASRAGSADAWAPIVPVPADAPKLTGRCVEGRAPAGYAFTKAWPYHDESGCLLGFVVRYDRPENGSAGDKQVLPFSFCQGPDGRREWR